MFIGEGPGKEEAKTGLPFVGRSGKLLRKMIDAIELTEDCYIANIVKCLRYNSLVQLEDGSWERIGRLVRNRYNGKVKSVDKYGNIINKKVLGWYVTPLAGRQVYKLTYKSAPRRGSYKSSITLTGDHPVITEKGEKSVSSLTKKDKIMVGQGFPKVIMDLIVGSLLGDGHICYNNAYLSFSHSIKQKEYALFKRSILQSVLKCSIDYYKVNDGTSKFHDAIRCRTNSHRVFYYLRNKFYENRKDIVPHSIINELNPFILAIWFMDDGYMRIRPLKKPLAEIATTRFNLSEIEILIKGLSNLNLLAYENKKRIYFDVDNTIKLSEIIAPYVPSCMRWKLHPEIDKKIPFDESFLEDTIPITFYDNVEMSPIKFKGTDKSFYCLDVEETHNFVTSGGVVHNCRPPNNRDPEKEEIEICVKYLKKQIEIINPKLLVLLGKTAVKGICPKYIGFNMKNLRQISKGFDIKYENIPVIITFHPAALLYTKKWRKEAKEDFEFIQITYQKLKS